MTSCWLAGLASHPLPAPAVPKHRVHQAALGHHCLASLDCHPKHRQPQLHSEEMPLPRPHLQLLAPCIPACNELIQSAVAQDTCLRCDVSKGLNSKLCKGTDSWLIDIPIMPRAPR